MKFTIQTHDSYPEDNRLELPAVDFSKSRKIEGYWNAKLIHSAMTAEWISTNQDRETCLSEVVSVMTRRLIKDEGTLGREVDYTLHVYLIPEEGN